jgi:tape measure domain-containing protein
MGQATLGDLVFKIVGDTVEFNRAIDASEARARSFTSVMDKVGKGLSLGVTVPLLAMATAAVKSSATMEMLEASFTTMLGSADKAIALMTELKTMAAKTPFETTDLANASKTLLQFGITGEKIIPTLQMLGDISQGNNQKFNSLALVFGQMSSAGRLMGQDLLQMINAGFNPLKVISDKTGVSMAVLKDRMSKGAISAKEVTDAFKDATSEGGRFYKGMDTASRTLEGLLSTLKDDVLTAGRAFADAFIPQIKETVKWFSSLAQKVSALDSNQKQIVLTILAIVASIGPLLLGLSKTIQVIGVLSTAIKALSASSMLTPLGLLIAGLAALTIGVIAVSRSMYETTHPMETYQKHLDTITDKTKSLIGKLQQNKTAVDELMESAKKNNASGKLTKEQADKLLTIYPDLAGKVDVYKTSIKDLLPMLERRNYLEGVQTLQPLIADYVKLVKEADKLNDPLINREAEFQKQQDLIADTYEKGTQEYQIQMGKIRKIYDEDVSYIKSAFAERVKVANDKITLSLANLNTQAGLLGLTFDKNSKTLVKSKETTDKIVEDSVGLVTLAEERKKKFQEIIDSQKTEIQKIEEEIASYKALNDLSKEDAKLRDDAVAVLEVQLAQAKLIEAAAETERDLTEEKTDASKKELEVKKQLLDYAQGIVDSSKDDLDTLNEKISDLEYVKNLTEDEKKTRDKALDILKEQRDVLMLQESIQKSLSDRDKVRNLSLSAEASLLKTENELIDLQNEKIEMGVNLLTGTISGLLEINTGIKDLDRAMMAGSKAMETTLNAMMNFLSGDVVSGILNLLKLIPLVLKSIQNDLDAIEESEDKIKGRIEEQIQDEIDLAQQQWENHVKEVEMANEIASINKQILDEKLKLLESELDAKIKVIDEAEKAELAAAGFVDKTELQTLEEKLAEATSVEEKAELQKEIDKQKIIDKYAEQRRLAEEEAAKVKRKILHDQAVFEREITIANIKLAQAELKAKAMAASSVVKGVVTPSPLDQLINLYDQLIASISAVPLPALATGGIVMPTPGGTRAIIGEGNQPEVIFPLDQLDNLLSRYGNNTNGEGGMMNLQINMDSKTLYSGIFKATQNKTVLISSKAVV